MEAEIKRILGTILIFIGLAMFYWDITTSYYYFTAQQEFPQVFIQATSDVQENKALSGSAIQNQMNAIVGDQINQQISKLVPGNTITEMLNASVWSIFATLLIYAGAKIIGIGRDFLKDAREDIKAKNAVISPPQ